MAAGRMRSSILQREWRSGTTSCSLNRRIRVVEPDGGVWTLAGTGADELKDGLLATSSFVEPSAVSVSPAGPIFVADGNTVREIGGVVPAVRTIAGQRRGLADGEARNSRFGRPSGIALNGTGELLLADSDNRLVRRISSGAQNEAITPDEIAALRDKPEPFREAQPARWPYDPPAAPRDIAGTLGELRGEVKADGGETHFHNGLDIAGAYGETARFIRTEKVLDPFSTANFGTLRELLRLPTLGYIHIRLGRDKDSKPYDDVRFQFQRDAAGKLADVRVPRGTKFKAGEPIGTLNAMNHVHLVAGRSGQEMNAIDALELPGLGDSRPPTIEEVHLFDINWREIKPERTNTRIKIDQRTRIVIRAYDQADGNSERRRLGVYKVGFEIVGGKRPENEKWTIVFDRLPEAAAIPYVYAVGSRSGATGETVFNYIVTNVVEADTYREAFLDPAALPAGAQTLRVLAADYFGNITQREIGIEVIK
jgi:hypothetical protein